MFFNCTIRYFVLRKFNIGNNLAKVMHFKIQLSFPVIKASFEECIQCFAFLYSNLVFLKFLNIFEKIRRNILNNEWPAFRCGLSLHTPLRPFFTLFLKKFTI